jgi:hypothetical protein
MKHMMPQQEQLGSSLAHLVKKLKKLPAVPHCNKGHKNHLYQYFSQKMLLQHLTN